MTPPPLIILMYHAVAPAPLPVPHWCFLDARTFRNQMRTLVSRYQILPLAQALHELQQGALRQPTVAVTFDDGYQNNFDIAFPVLRVLNIPATIFLTTAFAGTAESPWFCHLYRAVSETERDSLIWGRQRFDLAGVQARSRAAVELSAYLKAFPQARLLEEVADIVVALGGKPARPFEPDSPYRMLSLEAIQAMAGSGLVEFGAHTHSHAILSLLSPSQAYAEIEQSVRRVAELTHKPCRFFAYPNGLAQDYTSETVKVLRALDLQAAVTAIDGANDAHTSTLELRRRGVRARPLFSA